MTDYEPHDDAREPDSEPEIAAPGDLVPSEGGDVPGPAGREGAALVRWLEQSHRDATANRAQTRELVRTLEQVRDAHEYVGRALRDEQARNRRLTASLVIAPILAGLLVWGVWSQLDALRSDLSRQVGEVAEGQQELRRTQDGLRLSEAADAQRTRAESLEAELERVRQDLEGVRTESARQAETRATEATSIRARIAELEEESAEVAALRAQLKAMRSRTGVESARTAELEREVRRLERELGAASSGAASAGAASAGAASAGASGSVERTGPEPPRIVDSAAHVDRSGIRDSAAPSRDSVRGTKTERPDAAAVAEPVADAAAAPDPEPAPEPDPAAGAVRRPEDLARIKKELNRLLALSNDRVGYRIESIGGVRGETLLDVRISGIDDKGRVVRGLDAPIATVRVRADEGNVLLELRDGHLLLAGRRAPFFDGRYAVIVESSGTAWRTSGLTCVVFE